MAKIVVPLKVKIGLRENGHADHPNWQMLPLAADEKPATHMGDGWHYDKTSGHKESTLDSPFGMQWGLILVTRKFADEALAKFPLLVTELTEAQAQDFWEKKAYAHLPDDDLDMNILVSLKAQRDLQKDMGNNTITVDIKIQKAIDRDNPELGVRRNKMKKWADGKKTLGIEIQSKSE